ncbi:MAG: phosphate acetyltransferase [Clostridiales Family XIII bacterium]|jgi:phosphate acetyltransferase|nr:phosphate acetyltransferase [Clostridiales Family XIII bacterium]
MHSKLINNLIEKAAQNPKRIVFPESDEKKIIQAAARLVNYGVAYPVFIGNRKTVEAFAESLGVGAEGFAYIDFTDEAVIQKYIRKYRAVSDMFSEKALNRKYKDPLNFGAAVVKVGDGDCLAAGHRYSTGDVVLSAMSFIGMQEGLNTVSSIGIVEAPRFEGPNGNIFAIADCAVNQAPDAEMLADIAYTTAQTVRALLGIEPKVAMLSFSTTGSAEGAQVEKVKEAVRIANEKWPELAADGEFQLDAAFIPAVAERKVKRESRVAGQANIIIFPSLEAGNIGVKLIQIFGGALAHGPMLQGFAKPVTDFSRSAPLDEIVGNLIMLAVKAGKEGKI